MNDSTNETRTDYGVRNTDGRETWGWLTPEHARRDRPDLVVVSRTYTVEVVPEPDPAEEAWKAYAATKNWGMTMPNTKAAFLAGRESKP